MADTEPTLFDLPVDPDRFSVLLPPSELRKIDFSALEFATARRALVEYIKTYFPDDFNDFVSNNGVMMLVELLAYLTAVLSLRSDLLANESTLPTANSEDAVINHLALIGQVISRATPAIVDIECAVNAPVSADINIPPGQQFTISGDDGNDITYELFKSPTNLTGNIIIPSGKRGVIGYGVEGRSDAAIIVSNGSADQKVTIDIDDDALEQPITVEVINSDITEEWNQIDHIERAEATDKAYEVRFFKNRIEFIFGNGITGSIPPAGASISIAYRLGGGARGRIGAGVINERRSLTPEFPYTAAVSINFRNVTPSSGGVNKETLTEAKRRAPRDFATHDSIVTESDYAQTVASFNHPVFGTVAKAVATIRTSLNTNLVELYVLAEGPDGPVAPSEGLKRSVQSQVNELNVLTDHVSVLDAQIQAIDINATVVVSRSSDASVVEIKVEQAIADYFAIKNWDLGEALFVSQLYDAIAQVDGVKYVDIFDPVDNILATGKVDSTDPGVDVNELITLGNTEIKYYYEVVR